MRVWTSFLLAVIMTSKGNAMENVIPRIEGLSVLRIVSPQAIEITRDRHNLIGISGVETERIDQGKNFTLGDADHISLKYTLIKVVGDNIHLEELDQSQLPLQSRSHSKREITTAPFDFSNKPNSRRAAQNPSQEPQLSMEFAKRLTDAEAKKVDLSGKNWTVDTEAGKIVSIDMEWFRVVYLPVWKDKKPHLGGGFEFKINKNTAEIQGPIWHQ
jgi:hypothetical protein